MKELCFVYTMLAAWLICAFVGPTEVQLEAQEKNDQIGTEIESTVKRLAKANGFSGVVLVELRGEVITNLAVGQRDERGANPNTEDTLFEIGSATKPITALAILRLEELGKLSLDDSIGKHLPNVPKNCQAITIRNLMQHTSGIPGTNYGPYTNDPAVVTPIYLKGGPKLKPGTNHEYWNQGYSLLAAIIAESAGKKYTETVRELIYKPAGMNRSCFTGDDPKQHQNVAVGTAEKGKLRSALEPPYGDFYGLQYQGMGGAVCTAGDLHRLINSIRSHKLLKKESVEKMLRTGPGNYGLGWRIEKISDDQRMVWHSGSVRGFLSMVRWYPEDESCLILVANTDNGQAVFQTEAAVRKLLERQFVKIPDRQQFSKEFIVSIEGEYKLVGRKVVIKGEGPKLEMVIHWGGPKTFGILEKGAGDKLLFVDGSPDKLEIQTTVTDGKVISLKFFDKEYARSK